MMARHSNILRPGRLHRSAALLILALTFANLMFTDLLNPQLCREGTAGWSPTANLLSAAAEHSSRPPAHLAAAHGSRSDKKSSPTDVGDDCICCCAHILPIPHVSVTDLCERPTPADHLTASLPHSPPRNLYRPPRLS
jgi:hypothetical protein